MGIINLAKRSPILLFTRKVTMIRGFSFKKMKTKKCSKCKIVKKLDKFYGCKRTTSKKASWCKDCIRISNQEKYYFDVEKTREKERIKYLKNIDKNRARARIYNKDKNKVKYKKFKIESQARAKLNYAVRSGKILKPKICDNCKIKLPSRKIQGHHYKGYKYPLEVMWLCRLCHAREHNIITLLSRPEIGLKDKEE